MHEHWNDVPGDIAGEESTNDLPGGFGVEDPDRDVDDTLEDYLPLRILRGTDRITTASQGNDTLRGDTEEHGDGATVSDHDLLESDAAGPAPQGGVPTDEETEQQLRNRSTESQGPVGD